jgi:hypothetical protein
VAACAALTRFDEHCLAEIGGDNVEACRIVSQIRSSACGYFEYTSYG